MKPSTKPERPDRPWDNGYPTSDGKPMAETDWHRDLMAILIQTLASHFAAEPRVYVSGNLLLFYEEGNRRRHVSPDVFMVRGVSKQQRPNYLLWEEKKGPQVVIELTSSSTRKEDQTTKMTLYRDTLKVREYFLFDPLGDYLKPRMQGYRLRQGVYQPIRLVEGRLPSQVLRLHLEPNDRELRLFDPQTGRWLPTAQERAEQEGERAEQERERAEQERERAEQERERADQERARAEEAEAEIESERARAESALREVERLREELRRRSGNSV